METKGKRFTLTVASLRIVFALCQSLVFTATLGVVSCIDDNSTQATDDISIAISGIETSYDVVTFNNDPLIITPTVTSTYSESDLTYEWSYYDTNEAMKHHDGEFKAISLCNTKDIIFDLGLPDGSYTLIFTVTAQSTGYSTQATTQIYTSSPLSRGFVILKETTDGNTDVDVFNSVENHLISDMFLRYQGASIPGRPRAMDVTFGQAYVDVKTDLPTGGNLICITTDQNEARWVKLQGLEVVMDQNTCHYEQIPGEIPYRTVQGDWSVYYFTSNGVYAAYTAKRGVSGLFGPISGNGGSTHVVASPSRNYQMLYWNEQTRSICYSDQNGTERTVVSELEDYPVKDTDFDCLFCGVALAGGERLFFILQDRSNTSRRFIYYLKTSSASIAELEKVEELPADSHMSRATQYAVNGTGSGATVAYCVDGNRIYSYDLSGINPQREREVTFEGLPADEPISYISNRYYWGIGFMFNYLSVATQQGNHYTLRFWNVLGEEPDGLPERTIDGEGLLKSWSYIDPETTDEMAAMTVPILDH